MGVYKKGECWYIDYYFEGRRKREKIGPNKKLAETVLKKRKVEIAEGKFLDRKKTPKIRFFEMARQYLGRPDIKNKKSYQRDKLSISKLEKAFGDKLITEITPSMIEEYRYKRLQEFSYRKHETKPATVNREFACLKHLFSKAIQDGKLDKNPVRFVKMEKENNERDRALSLEEFIRLMKFSPEYLKPVLLTAYYTGMRRGEILNLKWGRVDLKNRFIRLRPEDTKTSVGRIIPLNKVLTDLLKKTIKCLHHDFVFTRNGKPLKSIREVFEKVCQKAGVENFVFHDFRHTCITNWRRQGHDYFKIMKATGHKTMSLFKRYNVVDEEELKTLAGDQMDTKSEINTD